VEGAVAIATAVNALTLLFASEAKWLVLMLAVVVVVNVAVFGVALASNRFVWYGMAVFVSVPLIGAVLEGVRTYRFPKLQPAALIRKSSDIALCGVYIGENEDRVYLGRVQLAKAGDTRAIPGAGRLFWVPKSEVDMIKIGSSQLLGDANGRAPELANELYEDRVENTVAALKPVTTVSVVKKGETTTTTTTETPPRVHAPAPKKGPGSPRLGCTREDLSHPLDSARLGWTADP
jgi:hypothetical protein